MQDHELPASRQKNVERVSQALLRSPRRSARRHSTELGISARSVRRILHEDSSVARGAVPHWPEEKRGKTRF